MNLFPLFLCKLGLDILSYSQIPCVFCSVAESQQCHLESAQQPPSYWHCISVLGDNNQVKYLDFGYYLQGGRPQDCRRGCRSWICGRSGGLGEDGRGGSALWCLGLRFSSGQSGDAPPFLQLSSIPTLSWSWPWQRRSWRQTRRGCSSTKAG